MTGGKQYAVREGRNIGIYDNWDSAKAQVNGFSKNEHQSFKTYGEAQDYMAKAPAKSNYIGGSSYQDYNQGGSAGGQGSSQSNSGNYGASGNSSGYGTQGYSSGSGYGNQGGKYY